jgi:hypothetical protein
MTTVVSRLYESADIAEGVAATLRAEGFPDSTLDVIGTADAAAIAATRVPEAAAEAYAAKMTAGQALFVCRAPFTPFGAARRAIEVANATPSIEAGVENENALVDDGEGYTIESSKILPDHPLMLTRSDYVGSGWSGWRLSDVFEIPLISAKREREKSVIAGGKLFTASYWPMLSRKERRKSVIEGGKLMTEGFSPTVTRGARKRSVMTDHPRFSERMGWKTIARRD